MTQKEMERVELRERLSLLDMELTNYAEELDCEHVEINRTYRNYEIRIILSKK